MPCSPGHGFKLDSNSDSELSGVTTGRAPSPLATVAAEPELDVEGAFPSPLAPGRCIRVTETSAPFKFASVQSGQPHWHHGVIHTANLNTQPTPRPVPPLDNSYGSLSSESYAMLGYDNWHQMLAADMPIAQTRCRTVTSGSAERL